MWWTKTFNTLSNAIKFVNDGKIKKMQILAINGSYTVIYYTESE